jgi:hypothetical protein
MLSLKVRSEGTHSSLFVESVGDEEKYFLNNGKMPLVVAQISVDCMDVCGKRP